MCHSQVAVYCTRGKEEVGVQGADDVRLSLCGLCKQVVDERMWGEDEDKPRDADAKYEKDAPVQVQRFWRALMCGCVLASTAC